MEEITYESALKFLDYLLPEKSATFPGEVGLERTRFLLAKLDNPQNKLKVIHIAGTSGKGSTAYLTSTILKEHGFKIGLTVSPYLVDLRERVQINNELISKDIFAKAIAAIIPGVRELEKSPLGKPSYFEAIVAVTYLIFAWEQVDYAIVEVGLGGLYDATNVVSRADKLCVITRIGLDHTEVLGKTRELIAAQKAGIIQPQNQVISIAQSKSIDQVFINTAEANAAKLDLLNSYAITEEQGKVVLETELGKFEIGLRGRYQGENAALAIAAAKFLASRDNWQLDLAKLTAALLKQEFYGRFQTLSLEGSQLILDGAHNPQKMNAFLSSLVNLYPNQKFNFLIAFKKGKDQHKMLAQISKIAKSIIFTKFVSEQHFFIYSQDPEKLKEETVRLGFTGEIIIEPDLAIAIELLKSKASSVPNIITGSLYLLSEVFHHLNK